jgi:SnoaL-like domain
MTMLSKTKPIDPQDRAAIVDALYRFAAGMDQRDRPLLESAFSAEASLDLSAAARRLGFELPVIKGRQVITDILMEEVNRIDTTHTVTNPRITAYDGKQARLSALVEAQNLPRGDHSRHLLLKNVYTVDLTRQGGDWSIDALLIENLWLEGDPEVLFPKQQG